MDEYKNKKKMLKKNFEKIFSAHTGIALSMTARTPVCDEKIFLDFLKKKIPMFPRALRDPVRHLPPVGGGTQKSLQGSFDIYDLLILILS